MKATVDESGEPSPDDGFAVEAIVADGGKTRKRATRTIASVAFVAASIAALALSFRGSAAAVADALVATPLWAIAMLAVGAVATVLGVLPSWRALMAAVGATIPLRAAASLLYTTQLGKYLPGGVWSVAAQATAARRFHVPVRNSVGAGLTLVGIQIVGASVACGIWSIVGRAEAWLPLWAAVLVCVGGLVALSPFVLSWALSLFAKTRCKVSWKASCRIAAIAIGTWVFASAAAAPAFAHGLALTPQGLAAVAAGYAGTYVVGIVVVFAPAGLGVREAGLVLVLSPIIGAPRALAGALVARIVTASVDLLAAGTAVWFDRKASRSLETAA